MWPKKVSVKPTDRGAPQGGAGEKKEKVAFVASGLSLPSCD